MAELTHHVGDGEVGRPLDDLVIAQSVDIDADAEGGEGGLLADDDFLE